MGVNVLQELSAEQAKFKAEITEDRQRRSSDREVWDKAQTSFSPKHKTQPRPRRV